MVVEKVALCITHYNRVDMLFKSFEKVYGDPRISRIYISDDHSDTAAWHALTARVGDLNNSEVAKTKHIILANRRGENIGCYQNKSAALRMTTQYGGTPPDYAILLDSDNVIDTSYLDALFRVPEEYWDVKTILAPEFARPAFRYHQFAASYFDKNTIKQHIPDMKRTQFDCLINCANYVVPVKEYLRVFDPDFNPWTCDTVYQLYNWLKAGNGMYVVPGMQYDHLIHDGSHYKEHVHKVPGLFEEITQKIMKL
jgi:hypothetical protein